MTKRKLIRFAENETFEHLFQFSTLDRSLDFHLKGKWNIEYFMNNYPIILEVGCGKGEYTVGQAQRFPKNNYIGIDIKGARLWRGCKTVEEEGMKNVAFIRTRIEFIEHFFGPAEVDEIWITFPDPHLKKDKPNKRLTSPAFIDRYLKFLKPGGIIHLKTDNSELFDYTLKIIKESSYKLIYFNRDVHNSDYEGPVKEIQTFYEKKFIADGIPIKYLKYSVDG